MLREYRCQKCSFYFEKEMPRVGEFGGVECPKCGNLFIDWINHVKVFNYLVATNAEYKKQYPRGFAY
jgi:DNA-directed RNA polymerase subunit RPC12/RpoP